MELGLSVERYLEQTVITKLSKMLIGGELTPGYTVFNEGVVDDESFDFIEQPAQKRAKTLKYRVYREVPGGRDTQQRYGDLVDENATIPMVT